MTVPLIVLACLSAVAGFAGMPALFGGPNLFDEWLEPVMSEANSHFFSAAHESAGTEMLLMAISIAVGVGGILLARRMYSGKGERATAMQQRMRGVHGLLMNKYYVDEIYATIVVRPLYAISDRVFWKVFDTGMIDGAVNGTATLMLKLSDQVRRMQTGLVQTYAVVIILGIAGIIGWLALQ